MQGLAIQKKNSFRTISHFFLLLSFMLTVSILLSLYLFSKFATVFSLCFVSTSTHAQYMGVFVPNRLLIAEPNRML